MLIYGRQPWFAELPRTVRVLLAGRWLLAILLQFAVFIPSPERWWLIAAMVLLPLPIEVLAYLRFRAEKASRGGDA